MKLKSYLSFLTDRRAGKIPTNARGPRVKPGRHIVDRVLCYDGSGGSGYTGRCSRPNMNRLPQPRPRASFLKSE